MGGFSGAVLLTKSALKSESSTILNGTWRKLIRSAAESSATTLILATNRAPSDLDPHSAYDPGSQIALQGPFESLIRLRPGTIDEFIPGLAESWSANEDKSVWTFQLRRGVTFQDGTPLDAEAARASFERLLTLGFAPSTMLARFVDDPARITASDNHTLEFDLGRSQPLFEAAIGAPTGAAVANAAALRTHELDGDWGHAWAQTSSEGLGTGPYQIATFDYAEGVLLERYQQYWRGWTGSQFEAVTIRVVAEPETRVTLVESGAADIATTLPLSIVPDLAANAELLVDRQYTLAVSYLAMTVAGPLQSPEARQAMCWAFPYDDVIDGVYAGFAKRAVGAVAELCYGFNPDTFLYSTNLDRARGLLRRAGVAAGETITYAMPAGNREAASVAELFAANLAAVGLRADIQVVDFASYIDLAFGDSPASDRPNLFSFFWTPDYNDAWNQLWPQVSCNAWNAGNVGQYCNGRVEELLDEARVATDESRYLAALAEVQQIITRHDPAGIYVAQVQWPTVIRRNLAGFDLNLVVPELFDFYALHRETSGAVTE